MNYLNKTVVVTGAAGSIGQNLVGLFLKQGATVWAVDVNEIGLRSLKLENKKKGYDVQTACVDLQKQKDIDALLVEIKSMDHQIDIWVNNAGVSQIGSIVSCSFDKMDRVMDINFATPAKLTKRLIDIMEKRGGGNIVNVASVAGHVGAPFNSMYCASKHALVGFTRSIQEELKCRKSPVRLMLVSPGFIDSPLIEKGTQKGQFPEWLGFILGKPDKVARSILKGLEKKELEIAPTLNGKLMLTGHKFFPKTTRKSSKVALTESFTGFLLNRTRNPD